MKTTAPETENVTEATPDDCFYGDSLHSHARHREALEAQLQSLDALNTRALGMVRNLDKGLGEAQSVLLAPAIYASAGLPPLDRD